MYLDKKVSVIIAAGGMGNRLGETIPKQFIDMGGQSMLAMATIPFVQNKYVDEIIFVVPSGNEKMTQSVIDDEIECADKKMHITQGGAERSESVRNGLAIIDDAGLVLVHDAARPYITEEVINRVIVKAHEEGCAIPAVSVKDTIYVVDDSESMLVKEIPDRSTLYAVQTPQGFDFKILKEAHDMVKEKELTVTDDGMPVMLGGGKVFLVDGDYANKKITTKEDLDKKTEVETARDSCDNSCQMFGFSDDSDAGYRVGIGFDVHRFEVGRKLILGGLEIPFEKGLLGHSDADVLTHALMDAILGALCLGDIGGMFPDTDDEYKGISSIILLERIMEKVNDKGYEIVNADLTVIAEKPKLAPYKTLIEEKLAEVCGIEKNCITVKATTTEKLGFTGREEGIGAESIVLLRKI